MNAGSTGGRLTSRYSVSCAGCRPCCGAVGAIVMTFCGWPLCEYWYAQFISGIALRSCCSKVRARRDSSHSPRSRFCFDARDRSVRASRYGVEALFPDVAKTHRRREERRALLLSLSLVYPAGCNHSNFCGRLVNAGRSVENEVARGRAADSLSLVVDDANVVVGYTRSTRRRASAATRKEVTITGGSRDDAPRGVQQL